MAIVRLQKYFTDCGVLSRRAAEEEIKAGKVRVNGVIAQLGTPDMRLPIQFALTYPHRLPMTQNEIDFTQVGMLTFEKPDTETFFALELAKKAGREGGILPTVFNSADEAAVELFMDRKLSYLEISEAIAYAMEKIKNIQNPSLEEIMLADKEARQIVKAFK